MDWSSILGGALGGLGNMNLGGLASLLPMYYASQRAADNMNDQAGRYGALGERAAGMADPFGANGRQWAMGRLQEIDQDPTKSPIYTGMMNEAMKALGPRLASQGASGSDAGASDWLQAIGDVNAKYTPQMMNMFGRWAGGDFDPANSARMLMTGGQLQGQAEQAALAARLYPLGALSSMLSNNSGQGGGSGGTGRTSLMDLLRQVSGGGSPSGISASNLVGLLRMFGTGNSSLSGLWNDVGNLNIPGLQELYGDIGNGNWSFNGIGFSPENISQWMDGFGGGGGYNPEGVFGESGFSMDDLISWWTGRGG